MATLSETLERISDKLFRPLSINGKDLNPGNRDYEGHDEEEFNTSAFVFDVRKLEEDELEMWMSDYFDDMLPEEIDMSTKVPFALVGSADEEAEAGEGMDFSVISQPEYLLFVDIENAQNGKTPIYKIDIDGTIIPDSFKKIADDIEELKFTDGFTLN